MYLFAFNKHKWDQIASQSQMKINYQAIYKNRTNLLLSNLVLWNGFLELCHIKPHIKPHKHIKPYCSFPLYTVQCKKNQEKYLQVRSKSYFWILWSFRILFGPLFEINYVY